MSHGHSHLRAWAGNFYNQLIAGTYWPAHDIPLEDIERIEILRVHAQLAHAPGPSVGVARSIVVRATWTRPDR